LRWTDRLQQRFGFLAIHGLGRIIVTLQVLFYAGSMAVPDLAGRISLDPSLLATEPWRLATFIFVPPATNPFFAIFFFMFQWTVFQGLEAEWGAFKLTLYCALGWLAVAALPLLLWLGALLLFAIDTAITGRWGAVGLDAVIAAVTAYFALRGAKW